MPKERRVGIGSSQSGQVAPRVSRYRRWQQVGDFNAGEYHIVWLTPDNASLIVLPFSKISSAHGKENLGRLVTYLRALGLPLSRGDR